MLLLKYNFMKIKCFFSPNAIGIGLIEFLHGTYAPEDL